MRWEAAVSLAACLIGAVGSTMVLSMSVQERISPLLLASIAVFPFALAAGTTWLVRTDRHPSRVAAVVAVLIMVVGLGGWFCAAPSWHMLRLALFCIPGTQILIWFGGSILSGRRGERP